MFLMEIAHGFIIIIIILFFQELFILTLAGGFSQEL